jgi:L,D-transpeptidase YcbB
MEMTSSAADADKIVRIPAGPKLIPGKKHPQIALLRKRLEMPAEAVGGWPVDETHYDDKLAAAVAKFQDAHGQKADGVVGSKTRAALNDIEVPSPGKILANMEHWRWMPEDLGDFYVWVNIPEYMVRVVKGGVVIHEERIVTGEINKQTPVFSDVMETIFFNPRWNVPDSIKVLELYPNLARGGGSFQRQGLKLMRNGREVSPGSVNWGSADIRNYDIYQPSGPGNVLGIVKFTFPNKHAVYMHDTTAKSLFNEASRPFSHGCMRVRNPMRLAEILLAEDKGWDASQVLDAQQSNEDEVAVKLDKKIPVHVTYLTERIEDDGTERSFKDIYGHEARIKLALAGKFDQIARGPDHLAPVKLVRYAQTPDDWGFFGGGAYGNDNSGVLINKSGKQRYNKNNSSLSDFMNNIFGGF